MPSIIKSVDCLQAAGLDSGLCRVLPESAGAGAASIEAGVAKVVLTGSAPTGRAVLAQLAPRLVPATMELSGCDAAFVLDDADLRLVVDALQFGLRLNRGRTCMSPRRVFVMRDRAQELERALAATVQGVGRMPLDAGTEARLRELVGEALEQGARLIAGDYYSLLSSEIVWLPETLGDQRAAGAITWGFGEIPALIVLIALVVQWSRSDERESRRRDRKQTDPELEAYNAYLEALAERDKASPS